MEQSPSWEAETSWTTQEIPHILWNPKVHNRIHKSSPPVPILSQIDPVHAPPSNLSQVHFNIIVHTQHQLFLQTNHQNLCLQNISVLRYVRLTYKHKKCAV
jgi:hypothetical protein